MVGGNEAMRLYLFECGRLRCDKSLLTMNRGWGTEMNIPVPFFLIQHPKGNLLFDTGNAAQVAVDPRGHWGSAVDTYQPVMSADQYCVEQLATIGIKPEDIEYIVLSHLHLDHAGGVKDFPQAKILVQRSEMSCAYTCDFYQKASYIRPDFDHPLNYRFLNAWRDDKYDVFGDGRVIIWFTPGHTPGHQSLLLNLETAGTVLLTADACYNEELLDGGLLPGLMWSCEETVRSIERIRYARDVLNAQVITGHDPESWRSLVKAPRYYE